MFSTISKPNVANNATSTPPSALRKCLEFPWTIVCHSLTFLLLFSPFALMTGNAQELTDMLDFLIVLLNGYQEDSEHPLFGEDDQRALVGVSLYLHLMLDIAETAHRREFGLTVSLKGRGPAKAVYIRLQSNRKVCRQPLHLRCPLRLLRPKVPCQHQSPLLLRIPKKRVTNQS